MTEDESLVTFGLVPETSHLPDIREILASQVIAAKNANEDSALMKLCCIQLFAGGNVSDAMHIWAARRSSFDNGFNIDVQLLCGSGVARTKEHLASLESQDAADALRYIQECESSGDFEGSTTEQVVEFYREYYGL